MGMQVHLITDHLIDRKHKGIQEYPHSTLAEFLVLASEMPKVK
jgi:hypothetical protein